jgi:hypothetical protein
MNRFRFSLGSFLAVVTLLAVGLSAMASQSRLAASAAMTAYVVLICVALAGSVLPQSANRPFWIGLAIFGWTYWFFEFDTQQGAPQPVRTTSIALISGMAVQQPTPGPVGMLTQDLIDFLETSVTPGRSVGSKVMGQWRGGSYYSGTISQVQDGQYLIVWDDGSAPQWTPPSGILPHSPSLRVAAHATIGGLFALLGGVIVALLFGAKPPPPKSKDEPPVSKVS